MEEKLVPAVTTLSSPSVGSEIFLQMSLRSTTSITFGLSDGTHQLNVLNGALKGLKVVVGHDGIVLISKLRTKKFFPWKNLLLKSCRVFNGQVHDQIIYIIFKLFIVIPLHDHNVYQTVKQVLCVEKVFFLNVFL